MGRKFEIPAYYRSPLVGALKAARRAADHKKRDLCPSVIDAGAVRIKLARHFGFCFGVENAVEIAYRALAENPGKSIFLLSEMIHNPRVNADLIDRGVRFLMRPDGTRLGDFDALRAEDVVIVPAFGAPTEILAELERKGVDPVRYNTTCPFVEKVWRRAEQLGREGFSVVIHGKAAHEETRATFSRARAGAATVIVRNLAEAQALGRYILGREEPARFFAEFAGRFSQGFDPRCDLARIGVVNQTTMLAEETEAIAEVLKRALAEAFGGGELDRHFADTRDTLCYATAENQAAARALVADGGDLALVVGGYNSSNTSHLVELIADRCPTFFISDAAEIISRECLRHFDVRSRRVVVSEGWLPYTRSPIEVLIGAGASCPDGLIEEVVVRVATILGVERDLRGAFDRCAASFENVQQLGNAAGV